MYEVLNEKLERILFLYFIQLVYFQNVFLWI